MCGYMVSCVFNTRRSDRSGTVRADECADASSWSDDRGCYVSDTAASGMQRLRHHRCGGRTPADQ